MSQIVPNCTGQEGNTKPPAPKQQSACKRWCFTLNNYNNEEISTIIQYFHDNECKYIFGKEQGVEGTPHLQGYLEHSKRTRMTELKKINNRIHWEIARGSKEDNIKYCSKGGNITTNMKIPRKIIFPEFNKP